MGRAPRLWRPRYPKMVCAVRCWRPYSFCPLFVVAIRPVATGYREQGVCSRGRAAARQPNLKARACGSLSSPTGLYRMHAVCEHLQVRPPLAASPPHSQQSCALEQGTAAIEKHWHGRELLEEMEQINGNVGSSPWLPAFPHSGLHNLQKVRRCPHLTREPSRDRATVRKCARPQSTPGRRWVRPGISQRGLYPEQNRMQSIQADGVEIQAPAQFAP